MSELSVTSKGQVTIPKAVRQKLGIRAGSKVQFRVVGDHAELEVVSTPAGVPESGEARGQAAALDEWRGSSPQRVEIRPFFRHEPLVVSIPST